MATIQLSNISEQLLSEWSQYAELSGLPLEYMILEAVTHSVRSDRLGAAAAEYLRNLRLKRNQKDIKKALNTPKISNPAMPENSDDDVVIPQQVVAKHVDLDSSHSAESLEDCTPTHV